MVKAGGSTIKDALFIAAKDDSVAGPGKIMAAVTGYPGLRCWTRFKAARLNTKTAVGVGHLTLE